MRFRRAPPRSTGGVSPSQFSRTRRHAAGESATSPAVATRISVAACWKGPPSPEPPAAAAVAASHASRGGAPGTGASVATTTSRSALSITRRVTGHPGFAARVSPCGFFVSASLAAGNRLSGVDPAEPEPPAPAPAGSASSGSAPRAAGAAVQGVPGRARVGVAPDVLERGAARRADAYGGDAAEAPPRRSPRWSPAAATSRPGSRRRRRTGPPHRRSRPRGPR